MSPAIKPCAGCGRDTRPSWIRLVDAPNSVVRRSGSMCDMCYRAVRPVVTPAEQATHEHNVAGLVHYLKRRRDREHATLRRAYYEERIAS